MESFRLREEQLAPQRRRQGWLHRVVEHASLVVGAVAGGTVENKCGSGPASMSAASKAGGGEVPSASAAASRHSVGVAEGRPAEDMLWLSSMQPRTILQKMDSEEQRVSARVGEEAAVNAAATQCGAGEEAAVNAAATHSAGQGRRRLLVHSLQQHSAG
jgi:hypothetical protein